ncbi:hypothetical protein FA13DRAFT_1634250 [Coprinellus micaceus]|uniref:Uncharacterized protein n=1 Tax=Coprinellus micaceus TaxID=71717 RepID=A0A4Y7T189_COPMI|nr:hypothetical protein FA13DRAFT_1634250 [Coprinellus micaceus]
MPHDPDNSTTPEDLRDQEVLPGKATTQTAKKARKPISQFHPFPNLSSYRLGEWFWADGVNKSQRGSEDFNPADVRNTNWKEIDGLLAVSSYNVDDMDSGEWVDDGISWKSSSVTLNVPFSKYTKNSGNHPFTVEGFHHRPLVPIIREKLESSAGREYFHTLGHELHWNPGSGKERVWVYGEMYTSTAFLQAYEDLQKSPPEPGCKLPRHVIGLMFASDATMLAAFRTAKLWPLYMFYGNDSKYKRAKPTEKLFETIAYFEKLPDDFKDFLIKLSGKSTINPALLTHCQRELFHEQWWHILDDEFIDAYCHGIVVKCYDGEMRHFYPCILTYSADYPEKVLLASIKNLGSFPCPRCNVTMQNVPSMGKKRDRANRIRTARTDDQACRERVSKARSLIYNNHHPVTSTFVEGNMAEGSLIPMNNAFSDRLSCHGFDLFKMLVVDIMHEVELGVWKALFIQILRLMEASDKGAIHKLDERYCGMPTFGRDTIRRFTNNVSEMKQLAARDWEDLLQCSYAAFEGLLPPPHNARLMGVLFLFSEWHGLAKLRLHTNHTLAILDTLTTELGDVIRGFVEKTCSKFDTKELTREYQARKRREARQQGKKEQASTNKGKGTANELPKKRQKTGDDTTLNLNTYKFHSLGDVVSTIRMFGTMDSYSTQMPERFHRYPKSHYKRTSKKNVSRQLSRIQMRQAHIQKLWKQLLPEPDESYQDDDAYKLPYFVGKSQNDPVNLPLFLRETKDDPAMKDFTLKLRRHLLPRIYASLLKEAKTPMAETSSTHIALLKSLVKSSTQDADFFEAPNTGSDVDSIYFHSDRVYKHKVLHINYTSYDVRRETDIINPATSRRNVMSPDIPHPLETLQSPSPPQHRFIHARVLAIFHVNVVYRGRGSWDLCKCRFDFLFVRWFTYADSNPALRRHDRVVLSPLKNTDAVGFLDPADVLRASHIVPRYSLGPLYPGSQGSNCLYPNKSGSDPIVSKLARDWEDWHEYYVNRFVDRDMLVRHLWGHGVGHQYCHSDAPALVQSPDAAEIEASATAIDPETNEGGGIQTNQSIRIP